MTSSNDQRLEESRANSTFTAGDEIKQLLNNPVRYVASCYVFRASFQPAISSSRGMS
jgi:hypothetical protein